MFFDLSIPVETLTSSSSKTQTLKTLARVMELGYTGAAFDLPFKGVMSDKDRCRIPRFSLSDLLHVAPHLPSSAAFHRRRAGVPAASPFRQYTRVTVSIDKANFDKAFKCKGVLKSYDLVAAKPLDQTGFDTACQLSDVDIIALDFPLNFRLNLLKVEAAVKRGVYFEIKYATLIADVQIRRQMLSEAKLLVEWTRGKNLIVSSSACSVEKIRGPHDVANLSSFLLGLSKERAKAAISRNCRSLIANALRKKDYKEAIRIERISSNEPLDSGSVWFGDWRDWDPISSGEGDLPPLDDISKLFSSFCKPPKPPPAIDFLSCPENFSLKNHVSDAGKVSSSVRNPVPVEKRKSMADTPCQNISRSEGDRVPTNDMPIIFFGLDVESTQLVVDNETQQSPIRTNEAADTHGVLASFRTLKHCTFTGKENLVSPVVDFKHESTVDEMPIVCIETVIASDEGGLVSSIEYPKQELPADFVGNDSIVAASHPACNVSETFVTKSSEKDKDIPDELVEGKAIGKEQKDEVFSLKQCTFREENLASHEFNLKHASNVNEIATMCVENINAACGGGVVSLGSETPLLGMDLAMNNSTVATSHLLSKVSETVFKRSSEMDIVEDSIKEKALEREQTDVVLTDNVPMEVISVGSAPCEDREGEVSFCDVSETFITKSSEMDIPDELIEGKAIGDKQKNEVFSLKHCTFRKENLASPEFNSKHASNINEISMMCEEDINASSGRGVVSLGSETHTLGMDLAVNNSSVTSSLLLSNINETVFARSSEKDIVEDSIKENAVERDQFERDQKDVVFSDNVHMEVISEGSVPCEDKKGEVSFSNDVFEDAFSEMNGQEQTVLVDNDALMNEVLVRTEHQNNQGSHATYGSTSNRFKSGKGRRNRMSYPAYLFPVKGLLKPWLSKKKLHQGRRAR